MTTLFGIKNCDSVKKARRWLEAHNIDYHFHDFRSDGLDAKQVTQWVNTLGPALINKRSTTWKTLGESDKEQLSDIGGDISDHSIQLIVDNPTIIKRPLLAHNSETYVGFSQTTYQDIF